MSDLPSVIQEIVAERRRQIDQEEWTTEHDDAHDNQELAYAAGCYAAPIWRDLEHRESGTPPIGWPFAGSWWKPKERRRDLVRAAALLVAEIERLDRRAIETGGTLR